MRVVPCACCAGQCTGPRRADLPELDAVLALKFRADAPDPATVSPSTGRHPEEDGAIVSAKDDPERRHRHFGQVAPAGGTVR
jgi:hypothetical protein